MAAKTPENGVSDDVKKTDAVLSYPDGAEADSGNLRLSSEKDFQSMIIKTRSTRDASETIDPWEAPELSLYKGIPWSEKTPASRARTVVLNVLKIAAILILYYSFVCSLDLLTVGLRLIAGKSTGKFIVDNPVITNPVGGVMAGLMVTVLVQSSSTSTSVVVSLVAANILQVHHAIPIVMGANIGTSVTNTAVALTQLKDRAQFRRAFAGATVHDAFNILSAIVLLTFEVAFGYLEILTGAIVQPLSATSARSSNLDLLKKITEPLVHEIVRIDKKTEQCWQLRNKTDPNCARSLKLNSMLCGHHNDCKHNHLFRISELSDQAVGIILFVVCILTICVCLISVVKILSSALRGKIARAIRSVVNYKVPRCSCVTGYVAIATGVFLTFVVQSSSVFTAALTPLVGIGVVSIDVMYPLTLGANIGTTTTAVIAAFAVSGSKFKASMQIALCHFFFNVTGIVIFYPFPCMRWPVFLAKSLGRTCSHYRWFAVVYIILAFFLIPLLLFGVAFLGVIIALVVTYVFALLFGITVAINYLQDHYPERLPSKLQNWECLPLPLRSLEPYHRLLLKCGCCQKLEAKNCDAVTRESSVTTRAGCEKGELKASTITLGSFPLSVKQGANVSEKHVFLTTEGPKVFTSVGTKPLDFE